MLAQPLTVTRLRPEPDPKRTVAPREPAAPARLLPSVSIVEQTMGQARRTLAQALAGALLIILGLTAEHWLFSNAHQRAAERHARAQRVAGELRLADQRLTSAAQMLVATGQQRWVERYDSHLPELERALDEARQLAPANVQQHFDARTRAANTELGDMREAAFEALTVGEPDVAREIFEGERYRRQAALLAEATAEFTAATVAATQEDLATMRRYELALSVAVLAGATLLGLALWRGLAVRLARSRRVFLDAEDRMQRLAASDLLTGLANRAALHDAMATAMARSARDGRSLAALMIDLDRFKPINDRHGHMVGDLVLKEVAHRMRRVLRGNEIQARYGGDEFVVAIEEREDPTVAAAVAERIVQELSQPIHVGELLLSIGASVGIARYPDDAADADQLLRRADSALYRAKRSGRGRVCFYDHHIDEHVAERSLLEHELREGIAAGQFVPFYQPIVSLDDGSVRGVEMLCRWAHPERGLLAPAAFIELAEETGQIDALLISVLRRACADLQAWPADWRLSVNLAPQQMLDPAAVPQLLAVLREHGVPPQRLDVELTETALVTDTARARETMTAMKRAGMTVTLDDFGTGYSSLSYLAEMAFDKIKIDRSFVHSLHERAESAKIVEAVIGLSRSLGVVAVAEGAETEQDVRALRALGCAQAQGYLFGRPMPAIDLLALRPPEPAPLQPQAPQPPQEPITPAEPATA